MGLPALTVFDIETTGLDPKRGHRIVEIAGVRLENGVLQVETAFCSMVNPERDIPWEARRVNKISDADLEGAPSIEDVLPKFLQFAAGSVLAAHNAEFDYGFLEHEKGFCWGYVDLPECLCTMKLFRSLYPSEYRSGLDALCKKFELVAGPMRHRGLTDAVLAGRALQNMLETGKIRSLDELRKRAGIRQLVQ